MLIEEPRFELLEDLAKKLADGFGLRPYARRDPVVHCRWLHGKYRLFHMDDSFLDETDYDHPILRGDEWVELVVYPETKREISVTFLLDREMDVITVRYTRNDFPPPLLGLDNYKHIDGQQKLDRKVLGCMAAYLTQSRNRVCAESKPVPRQSTLPVYVLSFDRETFEKHENHLLSLLNDCL